MSQHTQGIAPQTDRNASAVSAENLPMKMAGHPHQKVGPADRMERSGHAGAVVWLTGLPAAGKSTLAAALERQLFDAGHLTYVLDGDEIRAGLCSDLGFTAKDRSENVRRVAEVAALFARAGFICIAALVSPYQQDRNMARRLAREHAFIEVHVHAPLDVCEKRDPKGLYAKARAGKIQAFTGVSAPYEVPTDPEITVATDRLSVSQAVTEILECLGRFIDRKSASPSHGTRRTAARSDSAAPLRREIA
jgi:adenylyl-sulfate kinase